MCLIYISLEANIWSLGKAREVVSTDHGVLVYRIDNPAQSFLSSSLMFNSNTRFFYLTHFKIL